MGASLILEECIVSSLGLILIFCCQQELGRSLSGKEHSQIIWAIAAFIFTFLQHVLHKALLTSFGNFKKLQNVFHWDLANQVKDKNVICCFKPSKLQLFVSCFLADFFCPSFENMYTVMLMMLTCYSIRDIGNLSSEGLKICSLFPRATV